MTHDISLGSQRPMGIFWDMKSCPIPAVANDADLVKNIAAALRHHLPNYYPKVFFAYGDPGDFPSHLLSGWERDGLTAHTVCGGGGGDYNLHKQMLTHMMHLAMDHPSPQGAGMVLISQESDHMNDLWRLGLLGYPGVLVCPSSEPFPEIPSTGWFVSRLDWLSVARGSGQVFPMDDRRSVSAQATDDERAVNGVVRMTA